MQDSKSLHYVLGAALALIAVFVVVALVMINSQATDTNTTVTITNTAPEVLSVYLSNNAETGIGDHQEDDYGEGGTINSLVSGSTKNLYLTGVVSDSNGALDITGVIARLYRTAQTVACSADENDCYVDATCDTFANTDTTLYYNCGPFAIQYYADATVADSDYGSDTWTGAVTVTDGTLTDDITTTREMGLLLSLNIPDTINYGTLALGAETTTSTNQMMQIDQYGNDVADVTVDAVDVMTCSIDGTIPIGNQEWAVATDVDYGFGTDLTGSQVDTNFNIGTRTAAAVSKNLHWNIAIPTTGVAGICTGSTVIAATAH